MKSVIILFFGFILILIQSCSDPLGTESIYGEYNYTGFDSIGVKISQGTLTISISDSSMVDGNWAILPVGNNIEIGPQIGDGQLTGFIKNDSIFISLNPDIVDNNIQLSGIFLNGEISGKWVWSTFVGITNHGFFTAKKR